MTGSFCEFVSVSVCVLCVCVTYVVGFACVHASVCIDAYICICRSLISVVSSSTAAFLNSLFYFIFVYVYECFIR